MSSVNPYQTPNSDFQTGPALDAVQSVRFEKMAFGQRLVIYAVLLYFVAVGLGTVAGSFALIPFFASLGMSLAGLFKILSARESHIVVKVILFSLLFIPLINMLTLLSINSRATKALREAGYKVGFLGAKKKNSDHSPADATAAEPLLSS